VGKWPKAPPPLSDEQQLVRDDFMRYWHEQLPRRYALIERFNHGWVARRGSGRTLEIGAGLGEHIGWEPDTDGYVAVELREKMAAALRRAHPGVEVVVADCQRRLPFPDASFDRVLAIHVLEHLPNLPAALAEVERVLRPNGRFLVVVPCEGGLAYSLARRLSAERLFRRRYGMSYDWFVRSEHLNVPAEIRAECDRRFRTVATRWFPLLVPSVTLNLALGLELRHRGR
jgi:SAM-dependent methyltransferase